MHMTSWTSIGVGVGLIGLLLVPVAAERSPQASTPDGWSRLDAAPPRESDTDCLANRVWIVAYDGGHLDVWDAAWDQRRFVRPRDTLPYEIDTSNVIAPVPLPPALPGSTVSDERRLELNEQWRRTYGRNHAQRVVVPTHDGWLIGFAAGEFGGSLWWYPRAPGAGVMLAGRNVIAILTWPAQREAYVLFEASFDYLDAGPVRTSVVAEVAPDSNGRWSIQRRIDLKARATAHLRDGERVLIVTDRSIEALSSAGDVTAVADLPYDEYSLDPRTIALGPGGEIALGGRGVVQRLLPDDGGGYRIEWLVPPECTASGVDSRFCPCERPA